MNTYKNAVLIVTMLLICVLDAEAQCSITKSTSAKSYSKVARFELLFRVPAEDKKGNVEVRARLYSVVFPPSSNKYFGLQVAVTGTPYSEAIIPRKITFFFKNGPVLTLDAENYKPEGNIQVCDFTPYDTLIDALKHYALEMMYVSDPRIKKHYFGEENSGLFGTVLAEQMKCLE